MKEKIKATILTAQDIERIITRLTHEILEKNRGTENLVLVGLRTRGAHIAQRISDKMKEVSGTDVPTGFLDATFYRDDVRTRLKQPSVEVSNIPFVIDDKNIVLIDDVLFTGRTVRAALDALMDYGRPACIYLVVLVDRGHRELPIKADIVGKNIPTSVGEEIKVKLTEVDEEDAVYLTEVAQ
jgi:pyrimidine operon attenuation protein / uracil phosphoribosyltransferase